MPSTDMQEPDLPPEEEDIPSSTFSYQDSLSSENIPSDPEVLEPVAESRENEEYTTSEENIAAPELEKTEDTTSSPSDSNATAAIDALAEKTAEQENIPDDNARIVAEETQEEQDPQQDSDMIAPTGAFSFDGTQTTAFTGSKDSDHVILTNVMNAFDHMDQWYLIISDFSVSPIDRQTGSPMPLPDDTFTQGAFISQNGSSSVFSNTVEVEVPEDKSYCALCKTKVIPLAGHDNTTIDLSDGTGMLIGPHGVQLIFSHLNKLTIPALPDQSTTEVGENIPVIYAIPQGDGAMQEEDTYVFNSGSASTETDKPVIVVKAGHSLYGWNVAFNNGVNMSLADVRTYQTKNISLPDTDGIISYGKTHLTFKNAEKIKIYEAPSYCGYGKAPEK